MIPKVYSGHDLAEFLRKIATRLDNENTVCTYLGMTLGVTGGPPAPDSSGQLWQTWAHDGSGTLHIKWKQKEPNDG